MRAKMVVNATKYRLTPDRIRAGTRGSYGMEKLEFNFSPEWDGLSVSAVFYPVRGKPVKVPYLGGEIDIPAEVMAYEGSARFVLSGVALGEDDAVEKKIITLEGYIDVAYAPDTRGGNAGKVTPDTYDMFLAEAQKHIEDSIDEALEEAKESGDFKGEPGDPFEYDDFTPEQLETLRGKQGDPGVFVKDSADDQPDDEDTVMVDMTEREEIDIMIPDSLLREGDRVYLLCEGERIGDPFEIKDGKDGTDGKNFRILGYYSTLDLLKAAVTAPEIGDAYGVGTGTPYNVYVYDGVARDWVDNGSLAGVAGADGVGISAIVQTATSLDSGGVNTMTIYMTDGTIRTFSVRNGARGSSGEAAKFEIGTVTTGDADTNASASVTGTAPNYKLNLVIPRGADGKNGSDTSITVDTEMSDTSENAVQNKVIKAYIDGIVGDVDAAIAEIETILGGTV